MTPNSLPPLATRRAVSSTSARHSSTGLGPVRRTPGLRKTETARKDPHNYAESHSTGHSIASITISLIALVLIVGAGIYLGLK